MLPGVCTNTQKWSPPEQGRLKINVDAAIRMEAEIYTLGMVVRDWQGRFIAGKVMKLRNFDSVFAAEARGVCKALEWAVEMGVQFVTIETDCQLVVRAIQSRMSNVLEVGYVPQRCIKILEESPGYSVVFVQRQSNKAAHEMTKLPCLIGCYNLFTSPPELLLGTIMNDV